MQIGSVEVQRHGLHVRPRITRCRDCNASHATRRRLIQRQRDARYCCIADNILAASRNGVIAVVTHQTFRQTPIGGTRRRKEHLNERVESGAVPIKRPVKDADFDFGNPRQCVRRRPQNRIRQRRQQRAVRRRRNCQDRRGRVQNDRIGKRVTDVAQRVAYAYPHNFRTVTSQQRDRLTCDKSDPTAVGDVCIAGNAHLKGVRTGNDRQIHGRIRHLSRPARQRHARQYRRRGIEYNRIRYCIRNVAEVVAYLDKNNF